jgi:hypothetical protein
LGVDLEALYEQCKELILDSKDVVEEVEKYREDNRSKKTSIVLLAESHSHTTQQEFNRLLKTDFRHSDGTRCHYVNYVYCIGNSESDALEHEGATKRKTSQYWRIFYSCLNHVKQNSDFHKFEHMLPEDRVSFKTNLLSDLKKNGIWLVDASIIGINVLDAKARNQIIKICWEARLQSLFRELKDEGLTCVIIIGGTVNEALRSHLEEMKLKVIRVDQPQRRLKGGHVRNFQIIYKTCQKYKLKYP